LWLFQVEAVYIFTKFLNHSSHHKLHFIDHEINVDRVRLVIKLRKPSARSAAGDFANDLNQIQDFDLVILTFVPLVLLLKHFAVRAEQGLIS